MNRKIKITFFSRRHLPKDWVCMHCGNTAFNSACFRAVNEMDTVEVNTLAEYGPANEQFFIDGGKNIATCGVCGLTHFSAPESGKAVRREI